LTCAFEFYHLYLIRLKIICNCLMSF